MTKLVKEIDAVARDNPITGLKNPALSFYDLDLVDEYEDIFDGNQHGLALNDGNFDIVDKRKAVFSMSNNSSVSDESLPVHK